MIRCTERREEGVREKRQRQTAGGNLQGVIHIHIGSSLLLIKCSEAMNTWNRFLKEDAIYY